MNYPLEERTTLAQLRQKVIAFRDARDWKKFHNPKDLAIALSVECAEFLELCRFKENGEIAAEVQGGERQYAYELADIFSYLLTLADALEIDLAQALLEKMAINEEHYPVEQAKGRKVKYTQLAAERAARQSPQGD